MPKVQKLQPQRYVLVTSLPLSPSDKDKIVWTCTPFILTSADVIGEDDLDGLLSRHPAIERANFKLWLTSTAVLDRVLHNAEVAHTDFEVERIRRKLPVFVQSKAFPRAQQLLQEQRVAIISGVPGIGKTTLAEMLLFAHLEDGYQPVVIQTKLAEGKRLFRPQGKQIFYYDDFLGHPPVAQVEVLAADPGQHRAHHEKGAMREVHHAHEPEDRGRTPGCCRCARWSGP
jgi:hypothetical protein